VAADSARHLEAVDVEAGVQQGLGGDQTGRTSAYDADPPCR